MTNLNPYLSFRDNTRAAMEFYQQVLGGELEISEFGSMPPEMGYDPSEANLVMHSQLTAPGGLVLMASDTPSMMQYEKAQGMSVSLSSADAADADYLRGAWTALTEGAEVTMPLGPAPWGGDFGMLVDRFGIHWMFSIG